MDKEEENKELEPQEELPEIDLEFDETDINTELVEPQQEDDILEDLGNSLGQQISEELEGKKEEVKQEESDPNIGIYKKPKKKKKALKILGIVGIVLVLFVSWILFTQSGQHFALSILGKYISDSMEQITPTPMPSSGIPAPTSFIPENTKHRAEEYVKNFLVFGIEDNDGARNTDTMMIASVNTKDNTIKLTSILRDTHVEIPGHTPSKLNSVFSKGGIDMMKYVISKTFDVELSGYAYVYFDSFETIIDTIGGIDIELGEKETAYLNRTEYISKPENRNLTVGWNHMNGNQVVGYCRVRYAETLGGANNDFGRAVRQRRVIKAIFDQYKSLSVFDMLPVMSKCLYQVKTDLTSDQITDILYDIVDNGISTVEEFRVPVDGYYWDSERFAMGNPSDTYSLVLKDFLGLTGRNIDYLEVNQRLLHEFLFLDERTVSSGAVSPASVVSSP